MYDGENIMMITQNNEEKATGQPAQKITHLEEEVSQRVKLLEENEQTVKMTENVGKDLS